MEIELKLARSAFPNLDLGPCQVMPSCLPTSSTHSSPVAGETGRVTVRARSWSVCVWTSRQGLIQPRGRKGQAEASVLRVPRAGGDLSHRAEFQEFRGMTWLYDSAINQDHKTNQKSMCSQEVLLNKDDLGGGWVEPYGELPCPPHSCLFWLTTEVPSADGHVPDQPLYNQGMGGESWPSTLPPSPVLL